jgi:hypothetical protein
MDIARALAPALIWPLTRRGCSHGTAGAFDFGVYGKMLGHHHQAGVVGWNVSVLCVTDGMAHGDINGQTSLDAYPEALPTQLLELLEMGDQ